MDVGEGEAGLANLIGFFSSHPTGSMEFQSLSMIAVYSAMIYLTIVYLSFLFMRDSLSLFSSVNFTKKMELTFLISLIISQTLAPINFWIHKRSIQHYLNSWNEFQVMNDILFRNEFWNIMIRKIWFLHNRRNMKRWQRINFPKFRSYDPPTAA